MPDAPLHPSSWDETVELAELVEASGLGQEEVMELVALGALEVRPARGGATRVTFLSHTLIQARRAASLRDTFGLNTPGMALALTYLARIERLEQRLRELEAAQP